MIIPVRAYGWGTDSKTFVEKALLENLVVFTQDSKGASQTVTTTEGVPQNAALFVELDTFMDIYVLTRHFDVMLRDRGSDVYLILDSKGGGFKPR